MITTETMTVPIELVLEVLDLLRYPKDFEPKDFEGAAESLEGFLRHYKDVPA